MFKNSDVPGVYQKGEWWLEIKDAKLRKADNWGGKYTAITDFKIANGEVHIEGLLAKDGEFNKEDVRTIEEFCTDFGFKYYITSTLDDETGLRVQKKVYVAA